MKRFQAQKWKKAALRSVQSLFHQAKTQATLKGLNYANRCIFLARKLAMKARIPVPREEKRSFCKHCYTMFIPGENVRVRTQKGKVIYTCLSCKKLTKIVYGKAFKRPDKASKHGRKVPARRSSGSRK